MKAGSGCTLLRGWLLTDIIIRTALVLEDQGVRDAWALKPEFNGRASSWFAAALIVNIRTFDFATVIIIR